MISLSLLYNRTQKRKFGNWRTIVYCETINSSLISEHSLQVVVLLFTLGSILTVPCPKLVNFIYIYIIFMLVGMVMLSPYVLKRLVMSFLVRSA